MMALRSRLLPLALGSLFSANVMALNEVEPNQPIASAQSISAVSEAPVVIDGLMNANADGTPDVDYFSFNGKATQVIQLDIDKGYGDAASVDTVIAVHGPAPLYKVICIAAFSPTIDTGSTSIHDPFLEKCVLEETGRHTAVVSSYPRYPRSGGGLTAGPARTGDYQLIITGLTPDVKPIVIEVKPGNDKVTPINPKSKGKIPVAIMGAQDFDPMSVDTSTLTFGAEGTEKSLSHCAWTGTDFNHDGRIDRLCHFNNQAAGFKEGDLMGTLRGTTTAGVAVEGHAYLKVLPVVH